MPITYTIPPFGTPDPDWESFLNVALAAIQTHTHDGGSAGSKVLPTAVSFASGGFDFNNQAQRNAAYFDVAQQSSAPAQTAGHGRLYCDTSGRLYYVSPTNNVLLATTSSINYSSAAKGFLGDYGNTGGACYFNTASGSWPNSSTFFFYTATATPSDDTGSRAGLAAAFLSLKAAAASATLRTTDSAGTTVEDFRWGYQVASGSHGEYGLKIFPDRANTGTVVAGHTFNARETPNSATLSPPAGAPALARSYQFCIGDSVQAGAVAERALAVRKTSVAGSNNASYPIGYFYLQPVDGTGAGVAPATGFGMQFEWRLPGGTALSTTTSSLIATYQQVEWADYASKSARFSYQLMHGAGSWVTGHDMLVNSAGSLNVGVGGAAASFATARGVDIYGDLRMQLSYNISGAETITCTHLVSSDLDTGGITVGSGGIIVGSGGDCVLITATFSGLVTADGGVYTTAVDTTDTSTLHTNTVRNGHNNICAWARVQADGTISDHFNVTAMSHGSAGVYVLTLQNNINGNAAVFVTGADTSDKCVRGYVVAANQIRVETQTAGGALASTGFQVMVVGGA